MSARYSIRHDMEFRYGAPVQGSVLELCVSPLQDRRQELRRFSIGTEPERPVFRVEGPRFGNRSHLVHFFDRHGGLRRLAVRVRSVVEVVAPPPLPDQVGADAWKALGDGVGHPDLRLMLLPSPFVPPARASPPLRRFAAERGLAKDDDPLRSIRGLRSALFRAFEYAPGSTAADSEIEQILESRKGVCQDYTHVMAAVLRGWGIPTRYVSGYLGPSGSAAGDGGGSSSAESPGGGESHAWVECWLPGLGWRGFDPANDCDCDERHVRVAVGRDYADVPPVRGTFRGEPESSLDTRVEVVRQRPEQLRSNNGEMR